MCETVNGVAPKHSLRPAITYLSVVAAESVQ